MKGLKEIQQALKVGKGQWNEFSKFHYRKCEDILEAVKPLLKEHNATVTLSDAVVEMGGIPVLVATATYTDSDGKSTSSTACAGVDIRKKGMDVAQSFGSSSSYARKYALGGLFLIDNNEDPDSQDHRQSTGVTPKPALDDALMAQVVQAIIDGKRTKADLENKYALTDHQRAQIIRAETQNLSAMENQA